MEVWIAILQRLDTRMKTPTLYGPYHLFWLAAMGIRSLANRRSAANTAPLRLNVIILHRASFCTVRTNWGSLDSSAGLFYLQRLPFMVS